MVETISPDYLVIGAGTAGMAFADTLIAESKTATVAIIDRYDRPGGHWTIAYPFVTLHQPSLTYGVHSRKLGDETIDQVGLNKGFLELATGDEIVAYYSRVMKGTLLPSGRVTYYPLHDYTGDGEFQSIVTGKVIRVGPNTRIVDAIYSKVTVPSMGPPSYEVSDKVNLITPNALASLKRPYGAYTLVGAGKTAVDTCVWLLSQGIDPKNISWIMPRDSWFLERGILQPPEATPNPEKMLAEKGDAIMRATTSENLFQRMEAYGHALRIDKNQQPTMFKIAILSNAELDQIKKVENIIRHGRVVRIDTDKVTLERGTYIPVPDTVYIDCTASGFPFRPILPVWNGRHITLQTVKFAQPSFSVAFLAFLESNYDSEEFKNSLSNPIPWCSKPEHYASSLLISMRNRLRWMAEPKAIAWIESSRLDFPVLGIPPRDPKEAAAHNASLTEQITAVCTKLEEIVKADAAAAA